MNTARAAWAAEYREARKLARFIETFHDNLSTVPVGERTFPQCKGFQFSRLSGDRLGWIGDGLYARTVESHRLLLACLAYEHPRMPA
ncbi:hypothetical protein JY452_04375 [Stenotrophomonas maltophilia]|uniref:hypothetical protein n=1 Tax=Stenotrophomonas TaxID=40323 RepID=UPI001310A517|nr:MULTISPECIES: hypothetical protein [Stenotrophomonas]MBN5125243.1 hypothetical protein [Stenotrophomonas maltophilia]MBN5175539.1 hypothetical protein [Stenotrophomonas maltophilia]MDQ7276894.1 hypothetical protein [Stenotrophomonas sp. Sm3147]MDQ7286835.1 hypothetical protein [Stenotrophomonas sp. Sm5341]